MKSVSIIASIIAVVAASCLVSSTNAFMPKAQVSTAFKRATAVVNMGFMPEPEREKLSRETEPEEFFSTNTDKMSDGEKLPLALAGVAFITLPFIAGMIALYASK